ncbi:hypothetical protein GCM10027199_86420 [Amycolatopsis magusensis]
MESFDKLGIFWLAGHDDESLSGRIQYDPAGSGINLTLVGKFDRIPVMHSQPDLRIHGKVGTDDVTLDHCFSRGANISSGVTESRFHANQMFRGAHLDGEINFRKARVELSQIGDWVGMSGIKQDSKLMAGDTLLEDYRLSFTEPFPSWLVVVMFEGEDGFGQGGDAVGAAAGAGEDPPVFEDGEAAFASAA